MEGDSMRKINAILALLAALLFFDHAVFGGLLSLGAEIEVKKPIALVLTAVAAVHGIISLIVTFKKGKTTARPGASYWKENLTYWSRRISGIVILLVLLFHGHAMVIGSDGIRKIDKMQPAGGVINMLLPVSVCIHLLTNVRPMLIALGIRITKTKLIVIRILIIAVCCFALYGMASKMISAIPAQH